MQIFLQILGIIGIILLCIIGLALVTLALVLFVPLRYKAKVQKDSEIAAHIQATWLLRFIKFQYSYPEPGKFIVKICGIKIWENDIEETKVSEPEELRNETESSEQPEDNREFGEDAEKKSSEETEEDKKTEKTVQPKVKEKNREKQNIFQKIQYKIKNIYVKIKKILGNLKYYKELLEEKESRLLFDHCKMRIFKMLKHIKPRVIKADILFGTGEPDTTGYVLAIYSMFRPFFDGQIDLTPDFEQKILEGRLYIKGRITVINLLYNCARIYFDDRLHVLLDKLDRKDV